MQQLSEEVYKEHREHLVDNRQKMFEQLDKAILVLAGGGLTISLTLVEKIIPFAGSANKSVLVMSWICFIFAICSTLCSFMSSQKAMDIEIQKWDALYSGWASYDQKNWASRVTQMLNTASIFLFLLGVFYLVCFVFINLLIDKPII